MNIIFIGPQASGKGTQASLLAQKLALFHFSVGDALREQAEQKMPLGLKAKEYIDKGMLAPIKIVEKITKQIIEEHPEGIIFDGFPRTLEQAKKLDELTNIDLVIEFKLDDAEVVKRISGRRGCQKCRKIYGWKDQPQTPGVCDVCGSKLVQRDDDKPEVVKKRLEIYHNETEPLLEYYKPRDIIFSVERRL
jgi:adenylate kinase